MNNQELKEQITVNSETPQIKMVFHFTRVVDSDIHVEGDDFGDCVRKAIDERMKQCTPNKIQGEVE